MGMTIDEAIQVVKHCTFANPRRKIQITMTGDRVVELADVITILVDTARKYQMIQADYNARLKADMVAMLEDLRFQAEENIENIYEKDEDNILMLAQHNAFADCFAQYNSLIEERIDALKGD